MNHKQKIKNKVVRRNIITSQSLKTFVWLLEASAPPGGQTNFCAKFKGFFPGIFFPDKICRKSKINVRCVFSLRKFVLAGTASLS